MVKIPISFGPLRPLFLLLGCLPAWCWLRIDDETVAVQMSYGFQASIPRSSISSAFELEGRVPWSIGVHGWAGRWIVNGTRNGLVVFELNQPAHARVLGIPVRLRRLTVSVESPPELLSELHGPSIMP